MNHLPAIITDLSLILGIAAITTLIFRLLKQPLVLGYLMAGILVGPHFDLFPTVTELKGIQTWAEIGVLFLLFGLGLEFSFRKLFKVGKTAIITAMFGISFTFFFGYLFGTLLGWKTMDALFMGGILCIASTTIIIRAFDEAREKNQLFANVVMGVLVIEDLVAVVLMVVLSTISVSRNFEGSEMIYSILKLLFFLILWVILGVFFLPGLFRKLKKFLSDETLLIVSLALCFFMVILATKAGFSSALGAFIMGSLLAETNSGHRIEHLIQPLKDLFGAIFFVSVGMLIDPAMIKEHFAVIIGASLILIIGKPLFITSGALLSGQTLKVAMRSGMSLSQIGEFSFIIASLGLALNVTSDFLYPVAVAVSAFTTFTTPYMIRFSKPFHGVVDRKLPSTWKSALEKYSRGLEKAPEVSAWRRYIREYVKNLVIYSVIILALFLLSIRFALPKFDYDSWSAIIFCVFILLVSAPFLWALSFRRTGKQAYSELWQRQTYRSLLVVLQLFRLLLTLFYLGLFFNLIFTPLIALMLIAGSIVVLFLLKNKIRESYSHIENRFLINWAGKDKSKEPDQNLAPWDTHIAVIHIGPNLPFLGKSLAEIRLREEFGINIAVIERGENLLYIPTREEKIFPGDNLHVIGTDEQLEQFRNFLQTVDIATGPWTSNEKNIQLRHFTLSEHSSLLGKSIRASGVRERTSGIIVGIVREGVRMLNPSSDLVFEEGDEIWMVGDDRRIKVLIRENEGE
jgi:monovalent cation:H+ antiporter-2, CPA2 family